MTKVNPKKVTAQLIWGESTEPGNYITVIGENAILSIIFTESPIWAVSFAFLMKKAFSIVVLGALLSGFSGLIIKGMTKFHWFALFQPLFLLLFR